MGKLDDRDTIKIEGYSPTRYEEPGVVNAVRRSLGLGVYNSQGPTLEVIVKVKK